MLRVPTTGEPTAAMRSLKSSARSLLHLSGGVGAFRYLNRNAYRILMYHRFPADQAGLREQCEQIRRRYQPVSMAAVAESLETGTPLPHDAVAVTIDDGHRDFLSNAYPVFREYDIPTTVFLVSDFVDGKLWLWQYQVHHVVRQSRQSSLSLPLPSRAPLELRWETDEQRAAAATEATLALDAVPNHERLRALELLPELLQVELPTEPPPEHAPLSWSEIRELARGGSVEFGGHTRTHPVLSQVRDRDQLRDEIEGARLRLEAGLGKPVVHFCYPNGREAHINDAVVEQVKRSGFRTAVTSILGLNFAGADPCRLHRVGVEPTMTSHHFREALAGVHSSRVMRRLAGV